MFCVTKILQNIAHSPFFDLFWGIFTCSLAFNFFMASLHVHPYIIDMLQVKIKRSPEGKRVGILTITVSVGVLTLHS